MAYPGGSKRTGILATTMSMVLKYFRTSFPGETFLEAQNATSMSNATRTPFSSDFQGTAHGTIITHHFVYTLELKMAS